MNRKFVSDNMIASSIIFINILPLVGIPLFNWEANNLMFVYWMQNLLLIVLYSGLIAFAAQEPTPDTRDYTPRAVPIPFISNRSGWLNISKRLPPINYWNIQYITWSLLFGLAFWIVAGTIFIDLTNPNPVIEGGRFNTPLRDYTDVVTTAASVEAIIVAFVIFGMLCALICRSFFGQKQYDYFSAPDLAEIPIRIGFYWFIVVIVSQFILILTFPIVSVINSRTYAGFSVLVLFLLMKVLVEWSLFRIQDGDKPSRVVYLLTLFWPGPGGPNNN